MPALDTDRRPIRALSALLVNQIAAGEVIERPASVVKELVENAIDAGATRVRVELEQGGIELVRVSDDGSGIPAPELPLAIMPHATSKIGVSEDLDRIATMGFRGEALASIASVSRVSIRSRWRGDAAATELRVEGDRVFDPQPAAGPVGTVVTVRNLFFNTPARRKFVKTPQTERGRCLDWVRDLAMANPAIGFEVVGDGRTLLSVEPGQGPRARALALLGPELESELLEVSADELDGARGLTLWGLAGLPSVARATAKAQHVFLNGRTIRDRTVQHALREAYRGLIEPSRHPTAVLMLEMPPSAVDVNVHPAKLEVRFRDSSMVHQAVFRAVRDALRRADLTPTVGGRAFGGSNAPRPPMGSGLLEPMDPMRPGVREVSAAVFVDAFKGAYGQGQPPGISHQPSEASDGPHTDGRSLMADGSAPPPRDASETPEPSEPTIPTPRRSDPVLQVHNSYLVTQDEGGVVIIDQHALHERVMFEQLLARVSAAPLESQRLLTPTVIEASESQLAEIEKLGPLLSRIGVEAEPAGPRSLAVHAFPTFLFERKVDPVEFLTELLDRAERDDLPPDEEEAMRDVLDMMACKAAVKAGDKLGVEELGELLRLRDTVERSSNCPHGRPTTLRLTIAQLEKLFGRS
ncbi:MAG: DNA mismatch repair endonuclease MutL [Phycisphaerales bacterium]|nr:MAG: DNA mismatch repair endonuclease MutL [Phycisphaerales bacterium]